MSFNKKGQFEKFKATAQLLLMLLVFAPLPTASVSAQFHSCEFKVKNSEIDTILTETANSIGDNERVPQQGVETNELAIQLNYTNSPGRHSRLSPVVGARLQEFQRLAEAMDAHPNLELFEKAIYKPTFLQLIPAELSETADQLAMKRFSDYIEKYREKGVTVENSISWKNMDYRLGVQSVNDIENEWNTWNAHARVERDGRIKDGAYTPSGITARHELMHIEQVRPGISTKERESQRLVELAPTLDTLIEIDAIYKQLNNLPITDEVAHGKTIIWADQEIDIGRIANFYRVLRDKHGSVVNGVLSPESLEFIDQHVAKQEPVMPNSGERKIE